MHVSSFFLGIISIIFALFWYVTLLTGIMAIIFGEKSFKNYQSKMGKCGMITGIVGLSLFAFIYISLIIFITVNLY